VQVVGADFLRLVPRMMVHFASLGLSETRLQTVQGSLKYLLAKATCRMTVGHLTGNRRQLDAFAYVLERQEDRGACLQLSSKSIIRIWRRLSRTNKPHSFCPAADEQTQILPYSIYQELLPATGQPWARRLVNSPLTYWCARGKSLVRKSSLSSHIL
jgi:hypothetical protein